MAKASGVSEFHVDAQGEYGDWAPIAVVGRVLHPLIIKGQVQGGSSRELVVGFQNVFVPGIGQFSVAHQYA